MTAQKDALRRFAGYFSRNEKLLWGSSVGFIIVSFCIFDRESYMTLCASLIGVTSLIFNAKGNPFGQLLAVVFSLMYGGISYTFAYYGEDDHLPRHDHADGGVCTDLLDAQPLQRQQGRSKGERDQPERGRLDVRGRSGGDGGVLFHLTYFHTANIVPSTISVTTSFLAVYLTFRRSPYFALAYAANDIVLIVLWTLASAYDIRYISVVVCFAAFFVNDLYGYINWQKMKLRQAKAY